MFSGIRSRLTYANIMATTAVFIALGGSSYAVATGSIDSREIKNNTIRSKDIRNNEVSTSDVRSASLLASDFKSGQLPAGPQGPRGVPGASGARGPAGATNVTAREGEGQATATAECLPGERAVGGGGLASGGNDVLYRSRPDPAEGSPTGWTASADDFTGGAVGTVRAYVVCASP